MTKKALIIAPPYQPPNTLPPHDNNVALWQAALATRGFTAITTLDTAEATTLTAVQASLSSFVAGMVKGDRWAIIRTGHGYRLPDTSGDEPDGYDECLALSDLSMLVDDEMATYLAMAPAGTIGDLVDDFCYAGTADRSPDPTRVHPIRNMVGVGSGTKPAYYRYWQACQDFETSYWGYSDGQPYSVWSLYLCWALQNYKFNPATELFNAAKSYTMAAAPQTPVLSGPNQNAVPF